MEDDSGKCLSNGESGSRGPSLAVSTPIPIPGRSYAHHHSLHHGYHSHLHHYYHPRTKSSKSKKSKSLKLYRSKSSASGPKCHYCSLGSKKLLGEDESGSNRRSVKYYKLKTRVLYHLVVCRFLSFSNQDSICDRFEFEDIDENLVYVRFFKFYRCYDIIPISAKLVVFDTQLAVKKAFFALLSNGVRAAPLWDSSKHQFIGMLTITDFIYILRTYYCSPQLKMEELEEHTLDIWRNMLKEKARSLVWIEPDESLFNAIRMLIHNKVHRLPVIDRDTGNVLYVLTHKRLLKFLFLYYYTRLPMPSYLSKTLRELPQIGTYENIAMATQNTPLIDAITMMVERRISALPIVDKKNKVIDVYAKFDVIHLAADQMYQNLDITVKKALEYRAQSERVIKCTLNETLHQILERIVQAEVHRIIVVDNDDHVIGMISLSDLLSFLVLRPVSNLKCSKVLLEETEAESECESQGSGRHPTPTPPGTASSATSERHPSAASSSSLLEEQNQLTASSSGSSDDSSGNSSLINTSSKLLLAAANGGPSTSTQAATLIA